MFAEERHQEIVRRAREAGRVDVASLAAELDGTPETVRRDLTALERAGHIRRVHGGAIPIERMGLRAGGGHPAVGRALAARSLADCEELAKRVLAASSAETARSLATDASRAS